MTENSDVRSPPVGGTVSRNTASTGESTTPSLTNNNSPPGNRYKEENMDRNNISSSTKNNSNIISTVVEAYKGMTPAIKLVLALPGEKIALAKPIDAFRKAFLTCLVFNKENGIDAVQLFRDGEDPVETLDKKRSPVLKILTPPNLSASIQEMAKYAVKVKSYEIIYKIEINIFLKRQSGE